MVYCSGSNSPKQYPFILGVNSKVIIVKFTIIGVKKIVRYTDDFVISKFYYCIGAPGTTTTTTEHMRKFYLGKKWAGRGMVGPATLPKRIG